MAGHIRISRRRTAAVSVVALLGLIPALAVTGTASAAAPHRPAPPPGWRQVSAVSVSGWPSTELTSVTASGKKDAWALGDSYDGNYTSGPTSLWHWNGTKWAQVTPPAPYDSVLTREPNSAEVRSSGNTVWVIGDWQWLRYDGKTWSSGEMPGGGNLSVWDGLAPGPENAWVFGSDTGTAFAAHYDGSTWTQTPLPLAANYSVPGASAISGRDIWAVLARGGTTASRNEVVHWNGSRWLTVRLPASLSGPRFTPLALFARSDSDVWAGGIIPSGTSGTAAGVAHWNGHTWTTYRLGSATSPEPTDITGDGHGGLWILPSSASAPWELWHYTGGKFQTVTPTGGPELAELARVPGTSEVWGVGSAAASPGAPGTPGVIYRYGR